MPEPKATHDDIISEIRHNRNDIDKLLVSVEEIRKLQLAEHESNEASRRFIAEIHAVRKLGGTIRALVGWLVWIALGFGIFIIAVSNAIKTA